MNSTNADGGVLTFTPVNVDVSYIYEQFECLNTSALGYDSVSFTVKGPEDASVSLELQTKDNCSAAEYQSYYYTFNGLTGSLQTANIPLSSWANASLEGVVGFVWYGFSAGRTGTDNEWQLDNFQLLCAGVDPLVTRRVLPSLSLRVTSGISQVRGMRTNETRSRQSRSARRPTQRNLNRRPPLAGSR